MATSKPQPRLPFRKSDPRARTPTRGTEGAAGFDLFPLEEVVLPPRATNVAVPTGISVDLEQLRASLCLAESPMNKHLGVYGRVAPRSGHAARNGIDVLAGVIDEDYRGDIFVILTNPQDRAVTIPAHKAIAQLVPTVYVRACVLEEAAEPLPPTVRGAGGFGSTDAKAEE